MYWCMKDIIDIVDKYCFSCHDWVEDRMYVHDEAQCAVCSIAMSLQPEKIDDTQYYSRVRYLTHKNAHMIDGIQERSVDYQLDHMISVSYGFKNNIPPERIAHHTNLQMLPACENQSKGRANTITPHNRWILE